MKSDFLQKGAINDNNQAFIAYKIKKMTHLRRTLKTYIDYEQPVRWLFSFSCIINIIRFETNITMDVIKRLNEVKDVKYRDFQSKLVPNISKDVILGVKTPEMRAIAKDLFNSEDKDKFLHTLPHKYYEENLIHFFVISFVKDFDECIKEVEAFLPYVDCWPVSDQATPKCFKKNHQKLLPYIKKWIASSHVYTSRFGMRMLMNEYLGNDFKEEYHELVANKKGKDYYLKMMIAWYFATALAKKYNETINYFEEHRLDDWCHNKAIQKALESFRVSDEHKEYLRSLK